MSECQPMKKRLKLKQYLYLTDHYKKLLPFWLQVDFGDVFIPPGLDPPRPRVLPEFKRLAHGLRSGNISVLDAKTFYIPNLHYDGAGPDAYFWVGNGSDPSPFGTKVGGLFKLCRFYFCVNLHIGKGCFQKYSFHSSFVKIPGSQRLFYSPIRYFNTSFHSSVVKLTESLSHRSFYLSTSTGQVNKIILTENFQYNILDT